MGLVPPTGLSVIALSSNHVLLGRFRVLKVFLSRTAQRIPYMTSWRVLHLLAVILLVVCWFLVAWTLAICQNLERHVPLIDVGLTAEGLQFSMCLLDRWDYMMAIGTSQKAILLCKPSANRGHPILCSVNI